MELNKKLFETLDALENDKIDIKKAQAIANISAEINKNAKLMFQVAKYSKNENFGNLLLGDDAVEKTRTKSVYEKKLEFAQQEGFKDIASAIAKFGKAEFELMFRDETEDLKF
jgi:hypothetical protein